jgi:hypothetical protein
MLIFSAFVAFFLTHVIDLRPLLNWKPVSLVRLLPCFLIEAAACTRTDINAAL